MSAEPGIPPRRALNWLATGFGGVALLWAGVCVVDLSDGRIWTQTRGEGIYRVALRSNPCGFREILLLRAVMPVVIFGTVGAVCLLGAFAQPRDPQP